MPLFECAKCGCVDNTAVSTYWFRERLTYTGDLAQYQGKPLCSECGRMGPDGKTMVPGKWHGKFPKEKATPEIRKHLLN